MPTLAPSTDRRALETPRILELIKADAERVGALFAEADPAMRVPNCPEWTLSELVAHLGEVQRWATAIVTRLPQERIEVGRADIDFPEDPAAVPAWLAAGTAALIEALEAADPNAACYAWGPDQHVRFWIHRMLHETLMHRVDAEMARYGEPGEIEPVVAVDNIDEFLANLPSMARFRRAVRDLRGDGETIHLHATDLDGTELPGEWLITLEPDGFRWSHAHVKGAAAVRGTARELALWINRRIDDSAPGLERLGEEPLLAYWRAKTAF